MACRSRSSLAILAGFGKALAEVALTATRGNNGPPDRKKQATRSRNLWALPGTRCKIDRTGMHGGRIMEARVIRKVSWRIVPFVALCYFVCYLDRVNVGFAALQMNSDLGFTATVFGWGAGIFFFGYFFFEVPSNLALERFGARLWIARSMVTWGLLSAAMALIWNAWSCLAVRFLRGAAEAGFFPGI